MTPVPPGSPPGAFESGSGGGHESGSGGFDSGPGGSEVFAGGSASSQGASDLARVHIHDHDGVHVAAITGEVDISNVDDVSRQLVSLPNHAHGLVVDLRLVAYLDSTGISMLHDLAGRLRERSQQLIIVCPEGSPPRRVLELTGLITRTTVVDDLAPAVQALRHVGQDLPSG